MALIKILFVLTVIIFSVYDIYEFHNKLKLFDSMNKPGDEYE